MNDMRDPENNDRADTDDVAPLIRMAGARERVDAARQTAARANVAAHWASLVDERAKRRSRQRLQVFAAAASVVAAATLGFMLLQPSGVTPVTIVADVNRVVGGAMADGQTLERGGRLAAGSLIETGADGRLVLDLAGGQVMRLDTNSRLVALADSRFRLERGAVYVDSADSAPSASVFIETRYGVASDIGTQFQVRVSASGLLLGVREGLVALDRADEPPVNVTVGRVFELTRAGEASERDADADEQLWAWVGEIAPVFEIEGATLYAYLNWYARESGVELQWLDRASESRAASIVLSGSIEGDSLDEGLDNVSRIAPFEFERRDGVLAVRVLD